MKRIFVILLTFVLLLGICPMSALAETGGSGNVDGGGGDMGQGTSQNSWNPGMDGVRITVVDAESGQPVSSSFDLTNKTPSIKIHFGKVSKIQYANGASISPTTGNYDYYTPATPMPRIVSSGSQNASIEAIKKYFCSEYAVKLVAQQTGIAYEELIGGQYKLFLEPIAYFKHNGIMMAMTAHEAALYDNQAGGSLRKTMTSLTHKNLPLAMFLEYADMGFPAYTGATNKTCSNDTIISYLGMGIVWFTDPPEQPEPTDYDYEYRVDTDVITPVTLYAGSEINPDSPATVSFSINGSTYRMNNFVPGSPDGLDELLDCDEISEVLAEWPLGDTIEAKIQTYLYGDGETVRADEEDLAFFREHFDELDASDALDCISDHSFSFESDELDFGYGEESEDEEDLEL